MGPQIILLYQFYHNYLYISLILNFNINSKKAKKKLKRNNEQFKTMFN